MQVLYSFAALSKKKKLLIRLLSKITILSCFHFKIILISFKTEKPIWISHWVDQPTSMNYEPQKQNTFSVAVNNSSNAVARHFSIIPKVRFFTHLSTYDSAVHIRNADAVSHVLIVFMNRRRRLMNV